MSTVKVTIPATVSVKVASKSQREQGSAAFLRGSLTVAGKPVTSFRLNAVQAGEFASQRKAGTVQTLTLTLGQRGRPSGAVTEAAFLASLKKPATPRKPRAQKPATVAEPTATE